MRRFVVVLTAVWLLFVRQAAAAAYLQEKPWELPSCHNPVLLQKVRETIKAYGLKNPPQNIIDRRKQTLLLKNLDGFVLVDNENFTSKDDFRTAGRLVTVKINNGLTDNDVKVCKSSSSGAGSNIYLLIYPYDEKAYTVEIINFVPPQLGRVENLQFLF